MLQRFDIHTAKQFSEQWTKYQERAMAQRSSRNSMLNVIALAFQKCPRLSNLIIECYGQHDFGLREDERQDRFYQDIHPVLGKHIYASWRWRLDSMQFDIWDILKPAHDVDRPLSSLVLLDRHITCPSDWTIPTTKIFQSLKHLRHLGNSSNFLQQIVARAPGLESIGILGSPYSRDMCSLHSLIGQPALQRIRTFGLNRLALVQADLVPLILRHASTLQHLSIKNETYDSRVDWPSFARRVRGQLPSLRRVELFGLCQSFRPWLPVSVIGSNITGADLLQNHAYDLETGSVEVEDGLWEDYEKLFFSEKRKS